MVSKGYVVIEVRPEIRDLLAKDKVQLRSHRLKEGQSWSVYLTYLYKLSKRSRGQKALMEYAGKECKYEVSL